MSEPKPFQIPEGTNIGMHKMWRPKSLGFLNEMGVLAVIVSTGKRLYPRGVGQGKSNSSAKLMLKAGSEKAERMA